MTPDDLREARQTLGQMWGKGRPLYAAELGRALGLGGRDVGRSVLDYERGKTPISGPVREAVSGWLQGAKPTTGIP